MGEAHQAGSRKPFFWQFDDVDGTDDDGDGDDDGVGCRTPNCAENGDNGDEKGKLLTVLTRLVKRGKQCRLAGEVNKETHLVIGIIMIFMMMMMLIRFFFIINQFGKSEVSTCFPCLRCLGSDRSSRWK